MGRSDIMLNLEFIKKPIYFIIVIFLMRYGVLAMVLALPIKAVVEMVLNAIPTNKVIDYNIGEQVLDCVPALILSCIMAIVVHGVSMIGWNVYVTLILQIVAGAVSYIFAAYITRNASMMHLLDMAKSKLKK